jgi:hypothetical protein
MKLYIARPRLYLKPVIMVGTDSIYLKLASIVKMIKIVKMMNTITLWIGHGKHGLVTSRNKSTMVHISRQAQRFSRSNIIKFKQRLIKLEIHWIIR